MKELAESPTAPYFLEATIYTKEKAVIQIGNYCSGPQDPNVKDKKKLRVNGINWWWKPFYYKWVETMLDEKKTVEDREELIPLTHYYHRFTR